jgi:hypothetical protein
MAVELEATEEMVRLTKVRMGSGSGHNEEDLGVQEENHRALENLRKGQVEPRFKNEDGTVRRI